MKSDIVEALQCLKCMIKRDLLFWDSGDPCVAAEVDDSSMNGRLDEERESWDALIEDGDGDDLVSDIDDSKDAEVHILTLDETWAFWWQALAELT